MWLKTDMVANGVQKSWVRPRKKVGKYEWKKSKSVDSSPQTLQVTRDILTQAYVSTNKDQSMECENLQIL